MKLSAIPIHRVVFLIALCIGATACTAGPSSAIPRDTDLAIRRSDVTSDVKFWPYYAGRVYLEVMAVRAPDGTVRTAFNTCQVCFDSGRGYYKQVGDVVVCQNCGNRFRVDQIELVKGGCNPVPITRQLKTETADQITIGRDVLAGAAPLFQKWRRT